MAKDAKAAEGGEAAPPKKSKKLLIIIAALLVVLLIAGGAGAFLLMKKNADEEHEDGEVATQKAKDPKKKDAKEAAPVYVALDTFTVNLAAESPDSAGQYLQQRATNGVAARGFLPPLAVHRGHMADFMR